MLNYKVKIRVYKDDVSISFEELRETYTTRYTFSSYRCEFTDGWIDIDPDAIEYIEI